MKRRKKVDAERRGGNKPMTVATTKAKLKVVDGDGDRGPRKIIARQRRLIKSPHQMPRSPASDQFGTRSGGISKVSPTSSVHNVRQG